MNQQELYTKTLTGATLTIGETDGVTVLSIFCLATSTSPGTITGTMLIQGGGGDAVSIQPGVSLTIGGQNAYVVKDVTLTAPAGCTLELIGE